MRRWLVGGVVLTGLIAASYAGWRWGSSVFPKAEAMLGIERLDETTPPPSPEVSQAATEKLEAFAASSDPELRLESVEVSSLLRHAVPGVLPGGVINPLVFLSGDRVEVHADVIPDLIPKLPDLGPIVGILPDTVPVEVGGALIPFGERGSMLMITRMQARRVPVPRRLFPEILAALGRSDVAGLPPEAILVPVPAGVRGAYVEDGMLVLIRR